MLEKSLVFRSKLAEIQFCFMGIEDILNKLLFQDRNKHYFWISRGSNFFFLKNDSLFFFFFWERIWISADLPKMKMKQYDIIMSF